MILSIGLGGEMANKKNPYISIRGIEDPEYFCGREKEIERICGTLFNPTPISISVIGERRIGKTALLEYISYPFLIEKIVTKYDLNINPKKFIFVYVDLQFAGSMDESEFWDFVLELTLEKVNGNAILEEHINQFRCKNDLKSNDINKLARKLSSDGYRLIYLLDEFESLIGNEYLKISFYKGLRALAKELSFVTATKKSLYELTIPKEGANKEDLGSEFFNIFSIPYIKLDLFNKSDVYELMGLSDNYAGISLKEDKEFILRIGGYHPFFTTILCNYILKARKTKCNLEEQDYKQIKTEFLEGIKYHYMYIWNHLEDEEKEFVKNELPISKQGIGGNNKIKRVVENLNEKRVVIEKKGQMHLFSEVFREFVALQPEFNGHEVIQNLNDQDVAEHIRDMMIKLDEYMYVMSDKPELQDYYDSAEKFKNELKEILTNFTSNIRILKDIKEKDPYGQDPIFATRYNKIIKDIEKIKNEFTFTTINKFNDLKLKLKNMCVVCRS